MKKQLTHLDARGAAKMVDVGMKKTTRRSAIAAGEIRMSPAAYQAVKDGALAKGDALATARIAAINAAKQTAAIIPLCHNIALSQVAVEFRFRDGDCAIECQTEVRADAKTGAEMESLTAAAAALLTIYDMAKAADKKMRIADLRLLQKTGGKSGDFFTPKD
jgi:cyclic pyranopterin phosphate synthase